MIEKELPCDIPVSKTFQSLAFMNGILLTHDNLKEEYYNSNINIYIVKPCKKHNDIPFITCDNLVWNELARHNTIGLTKYQFGEIKENFLEVVKKELTNGNYVCVLGFDDYYVSYSSFYQKVHIIHDLYIYGYRDDQMYVMVYKDQQLQKLLVPEKEIEGGFLSESVDKEEAFTYAIHIDPNVERKLDISRIKRELTYYVNGTTCEEDLSDELSYGISVYQELKDYMINMRDEKIHRMDMRLFRFLWECKIIMVERVKRIKEDYFISDEILDDASKIETKAHQLFQMIMKYKIRKSSTLIQRIIQKIDELKEDDIKFTNLLIHELSEY